MRANSRAKVRRWEGRRFSRKRPVQLLPLALLERGQLLEGGAGLLELPAHAREAQLPAQAVPLRLEPSPVLLRGEKLLPPAVDRRLLPPGTPQGEQTHEAQDTGRVTVPQSAQPEGQEHGENREPRPAHRLERSRAPRPDRIPRRGRGQLRGAGGPDGLDRPPRGVEIEGVGIGAGGQIEEGRPALVLDPAPRARPVGPRVDVARVVAAGREPRLELVERAHPLRRRRPRPAERRFAAEGPLQELGNERRDVTQAQREGRGLPALPRRLHAEGEDPLPDRRLHGNGALGVPAREGVPAHEQELEDEDGEAEAVVILGAHDAVEPLALEPGGVKRGTPTRHGYVRPRCVIWKESQSMRRTPALRETTTLPWFTSPITCPCAWTVSNAAATLRAVFTRNAQDASGKAVLRSVGP